MSKTDIKNLLNNFMVFFDKMSNYPQHFPICQSKSEQDFFIKHIESSKKYLEYGSGGSTFLVLMKSKADIVSVETDVKWLNYIREWKLIKRNEKSRLNIEHVDFGETKQWGIPVKIEENKNKFPDYSSNIYKKYGKDFDLIFIDGRFRVACTLQAILNSCRETKIIMHDFTNRKHYHSVLEFLEIRAVSDTMTLFKIKKKLTNQKLKACIKNINMIGVRNHFNYKKCSKS